MNVGASFVNALNKYKLPDPLTPLQKDIVDFLVAGKDVVAVLPTGYGKSLLYILPPLLFDEVRVFVSDRPTSETCVCNN